MKKQLIMMSLLIFAAGAASAKLANENLNGLYSRSIEQVLRLDPEEIDIGTAALIVSEQWSDIVPGRRYQEELDEMAMDIQKRVEEKKIKAKYKIVLEINDYLYNEKKFKAVKEADDPHDLFLHSVMDKRQGYCLSLSVLYLAMGERLGLPLYGVVVPGHFFVRYDDGNIRFNIEATSNGVSPPDEHYIETFNVPDDYGDGIYLKNLDKLQSMGCFFNNLGTAYMTVGDVDMAIESLSLSAEINPSLAEARLNLANMYLVKGRTDDAIDQCKEALRINPNEANARVNLANAYIQQEKYRDAAFESLTAIKINPKLIGAYRNLAVAYANQQRYTDAISTLKNAMSIEPSNAELFSDMGNVYSQMDNCDTALQYYARAIRLKSNLIQAHYNSGVCYSKQRRFEQAIESYKTALAYDPDMGAAHHQLVYAYYNTGQYELAQQHAIRAEESGENVKPELMAEIEKNL